MVRDGLFSFRCVCRLELERSGCVRRGPLRGSGSAPVGRPLRPSPQRRAPPARYRLETCPAAGLGPRPLPAACPKSSGAYSAGCALFYSFGHRPPVSVQFRTDHTPQSSGDTRFHAPPAIDITTTAALVCATIMFRPEPPRPRGKHEPFPPARGAGAECSFGSLAPVSLPRPRDASTSSTSSQISSGPLRSHLRSHLVLSDLLSSTLRSRWRRP